ncbi:hypothetical protein [uncultured Shewanella sp.]|uniref:hypothetical protein n=1 Tax=uncultured Shewanella sp. TaxID=173975 RepID=UPI00263248CB|nr:hypothetical protein [uncultured Shewanella sp.]
MKKIIKLSALIGLSVLGTNAMASTMECYVDTPAYDEFRSRTCFAMIYGQRYTTAVFRIVEDKAIASVLWGGAAAGKCTDNGNYCSFTIRSMSAYSVSATVLYEDGTYGTASAVASFEDGR